MCSLMSARNLRNLEKKTFGGHKSFLDSTDVGFLVMSA